jgi:hypothetical protein
VDWRETHWSSLGHRRRERVPPRQTPRIYRRLHKLPSSPIFPPFSFALTLTRPVGTRSNGLRRHRPHCTARTPAFAKGLKEFWHHNFPFPSLSLRMGLSFIDVWTTQKRGRRLAELRTLLSMLPMFSVVDALTRMLPLVSPAKRYENTARNLAFTAPPSQTKLSAESCYG